MVLANVLQGGAPVKADGSLDAAKFTEAINGEVKRLGAVLSEATGGGLVTGMGASDPTPIDPKQAKLDKKAAKEARKEAVKVFESLGMSHEDAKAAARGREEAA
jgi:hypothetical protein